MVIKLSEKLYNKITKFKNSKRGFRSFIIFSVIFILTCFAEFIANDKPLIVVYEGKIYFPIVKQYLETDFGGTLKVEADYKDPFVKDLINKKGFFIFPIIPYSYDTIVYDITEPTPTKPSLKNILGTDDMGRDVCSRLIYGTRYSLLFGILLTFFSSVIGICVGAIQGYFGGKLDLWGQRFLEIWSSLPQLFILIIISSVFTPGFWTLLLVLTLFSWTNLVGVVRAEFYRIKNFDYVKAAYVFGLSDFQIMYKHVLPNAMIATITYLPFILSGAVVALTALDFLGFGLPPGQPSLGELVRQGVENLQAPWLALTSFISLSLLLTLLIFIGETIRDVFDPRKEVIC